MVAKIKEASIWNTSQKDAQSGDIYTVSWREHGVVLCPGHARKNRGILSRKASELIVI